MTDMKTQTVAPTDPNGTRSRGLRDGSPLQRSARAFAKNRLAVAGAVFIIVMITACVAAPLLVTTSPEAVDVVARLSGPSPKHPLGTDDLGRDVLSRLLYGGRVSIAAGIGAAIATVLLGTVLGGIAGVGGRTVDAVIMRAADVALALPMLVAGIAFAGIFGPSLTMIIVTVAVFGWPTTCRLVRSVALTIRDQDFVNSARVSGATKWWIVRHHLVPAAVGPITVTATLMAASSVMFEAALSFLGLGIQAPTPSWGNMLSDAQSLTLIQFAPWLWIFPGLAIALTVLALNFLGDGLRDATDPGSMRREG